MFLSRNMHAPLLVTPAVWRINDNPVVNTFFYRAFLVIAANPANRYFEGLNFIGMDVVEVAPAYDISEISSVAAASVIFEYLSVVQK